MQKQQKTMKKAYQSMAILQKLIRIDSKDCNFYFKDDLRKINFKVAYPQINIDNNSNESLLRQLWYHIYSHYFKKIEQQEFRRLQYAKLIFNNSLPALQPNQNQISRLLCQQRQFSKDLHQLYNQSYLNDLLTQSIDDIGIELWLKRLLVTTKTLDLLLYIDKQKQMKSKIIFGKLKQNRKYKSTRKTKKAILKLVERDHQQIDLFLQQLHHIQKNNHDEIDNQILKLERQLSSIQISCLSSLEDIEKKVKQEVQCHESKGHLVTMLASNKDYSKHNRQDLQCLEYLIRSLQQKQISQSVAKIISTQKSSGEIMFQILYEKAINIEPKLISQAQLNKINHLRETSLVQFYRTGVKSTYSYICHNYVGFRQLMQNRLCITSRMKDKCILQMMKKGACLASLPQIQHQMSSFNICHHCKFLYHENNLFTCKFSSDKQSLPRMNLEALNDPNLNQSLNAPIKNRSSQRFMTRKKNCLTSYAKIRISAKYKDDQYVCGRKYCYSCLKDNYSHEHIRQNGLCPFCLGVCICTRCLRNEKIAKFKTMYINFGGDIMKIQQGSELQQLQVRSEMVNQRGRGRPKKYAMTHISINMTQKKLRKFDDKQNYVYSGYNTGKNKGKKMVSSNNGWKKSYQSGVDTQQQADLKKKRISYLKKRMIQKGKFKIGASLF